MKSFVLIYHRHSGDLQVEPFEAGQRAAAFARRSQLQRTVDEDTEVVVFHANNLDDLRKTHRRYFESAGEMLDRIAI